VLSAISAGRLDAAEHVIDLAVKTKLTREATKGARAAADSGRASKAYRNSNLPQASASQRAKRFGDHPRSSTSSM
jgi:hypothetical protein